MMDAEPARPLEEVELVDWRALPPAQRRAWWELIWRGAVCLSERYRLALRSRWWEDAVQVEALAAFDCWLRLYDTGAETDPTGKLQLLWELERLRGALRGGDHAFDKTRDRAAFERHVTRIIIGRDVEADNTGATEQCRPQLTEELITVSERLLELRQRRETLRMGIESGGQPGDLRLLQARRDLRELDQALEELERREHDLRVQTGDVVGS